MSGRIIAQVIVTGAQIVGKAFVEAYKVAAAEAANKAVNQSSKGSSDPLTQKTGISLDESYQILNVPKNASLSQVIERYQVLFKINDPAKGGSFYLQSKIVRAKERVELEQEKSQEEPKST